MSVHSGEKIKQLKSLRRKGHSINEIVLELSIPKTTVWRHTQSVKILPRHVLALKAKRGGSAKRYIRNTEKAQERAKVLLRGPQREKVIALAMLYWAEGHKTKSCEFINSDGSMIKLYLQIIRHTFSVPEESIRPTMRFFTGMDRTSCLTYWSSVTGIPRQKFTIRYNDGGTRGRTKYGMCRITVTKGSQTLKLFLALIDQIKQEMVN